VCVVRHRWIVMVSGEEIVSVQCWLWVILSLNWKIEKMWFWLGIQVNGVDPMLLKVILEVNSLAQCAGRLLLLLRRRRIERSLIIDAVVVRLRVRLRVLTIHS